MDENSVDSGMSDSVKLGILIHRMGTLESGVESLKDMVGNMGTLYPTTIHVDLIVAPLREKITNLENNEKERERDRIKQTAQFKLAMAMAVVAPLITLFITLVLDRK
jgi:hypothetical protein